MSNLCVVIPSRIASNLVRCVAAVRENEPEARIIVVDDGVDWQWAPSVVFLTPTPIMPNAPVTIVQGVKPFVFARNVNLGIRAAGDSDVVVLNDDALLETPGGFSLMQQAAADNPAVGIVGAVTDLTGQPRQRKPRNPFLEGTARGIAGYGLRATEHFAFVCVLIPARTRQALAEFTEQLPNVLTGGYLDERYTAYGSDDLDYCMQCERIALCVCVHDGCYVNHGALHSTYRGAPTAAGDIWPNHRLLRRKWNMPPNPQDPMYRQLVAAG